MSDNGRRSPSLTGGAADSGAEDQVAAGLPVFDVLRVSPAAEAETARVICRWAWAGTL